MKHLEDLQQEDEYNNRVQLFRTYFSLGTFNYPICEFDPRRYIGTRKDYDILIAPFYESEKHGKIIGMEIFDAPELIEVDVTPAPTPAPMSVYGNSFNYEDIPKEVTSEAPNGETYEEALVRVGNDMRINRKRKKMLRAWYNSN